MPGVCFVKLGPLDQASEFKVRILWPLCLNSVVDVDTLQLKLAAEIYVESALPHTVRLVNDRPMQLRFVPPAEFMFICFSDKSQFGQKHFEGK